LARRDRKGSLNDGQIQNPFNPFGIVPLSNFVPRGLGFVRHSIAILYHEVPNPNLTIRNFFIAAPQPASCEILPLPAVFAHWSELQNMINLSANVALNFNKPLQIYNKTEPPFTWGGWQGPLMYSEPVSLPYRASCPPVSLITGGEAGSGETSPPAASIRASTPSETRPRVTALASAAGCEHPRRMQR
jgi:hypothetical protein